MSALINTTLIGIALAAEIGASQPLAAVVVRPDSAKVEFFTRQIFPLLKENCFKCHGGGEKLKSNFRITSREGLVRGGDEGPALNLVDPDQSRLLAMLSYKDRQHQMPPDKKLSPSQIDQLTQWVRMGAPYDGRLEIVGNPNEHLPTTTINDRTKNYWAFKPIVRPVVPRVTGSTQPKNPIDAFINHKLAAKNLVPNKSATRQQLIRRAYFDLIGLPPTLEEVAAFEADKSSNAFEKVIDQLLARPQYGEKWGRHWLDLVRYAESNGYERDGDKPFVWRYRDYVVRAFNEDKPYDRFILEQLAGDELGAESPDPIIATGYYRLGLWDDEPADPLLARFDELDDYVATTSQVFLGLTMNCARCHDHKIDPIPQADYYRFLSFFADIDRYSASRGTRSRANLTDITPLVHRATYQQELDDREAAIRQIAIDLRRIEDEVIKKMPAEDRDAAAANDREAVIKRRFNEFASVEQRAAADKLKQRRDELLKKPEPPRDFALSVNNCIVKPPSVHILRRGNPHSPAAEVLPGFPAIIGTPDPVIPAAAPGAKTSGRRIVLARWIASKENPLTSRNIANRLWQFHFGRGIVRSANNFGHIGDRPSHPELLDWLATELTDGGWSLKRMHKLIMLSQTYQMSSSASAAGIKTDPNNELFWKYDMRRLSAEEVRDSILNLTGQLNLKQGGPSIHTEMPKEVLATSSQPHNAWGKSPIEEQRRRSIYIRVRRSLPEPLLKVFDFADTDSSCDVRFVTTVPTQSLTLLNSKFLNDQADALAEKLVADAPGNLRRQVQLAIARASNRPASEEEIADGLRMIGDLRGRLKLEERAALSRFCLLVLNLNEFIYLD